MVRVCFGPPTPVLAQDQVPITIVVNQSPWFAGFQKVVEQYQEKTGNTVTLDVNPFAGSLEKQRSAVRAKESPYDILVMNAGFFIEMYQGGFLKPLKDIDASFTLSKDKPFHAPSVSRINSRQAGPVQFVTGLDMVVSTSCPKNAKSFAPTIMRRLRSATLC